MLCKVSSTYWIVFVVSVLHLLGEHGFTDGMGCLRVVLSSSLLETLSS